MVQTLPALGIAAALALLLGGAALACDAPPNPAHRYAAPPPPCSGLYPAGDPSIFAMAEIVPHYQEKQMKAWVGVIADPRYGEFIYGPAIYGPYVGPAW